MMKKTVGTVMLLMGFVAASQAVLLLDEDFSSYKTGSITGQTGPGAYYTGSWTGPAFYKVSANGYLSCNKPGWGGVMNSLAYSFNASTGGVYYASMRVRFKTVDAAGGLRIAFVNTEQATNYLFGVMLTTKQTRLINQYSSVGSAGNYDLSNGTWGDIYLKWEQNPMNPSQSKVTLWINPTGVESGADYTLNHTAAFKADSPLNALVVNIWQTQGALGEFGDVDIIKVGTSWDDVSLIPKP